MIDKINEELDQIDETLIELEDELEMEISRVIALKNSIDPELIEDLEKIEEGLYVEVKMINETKKNIEIVINEFKNKNGSKRKVEMVDSKEIQKYVAEVDKFKKRSEKLAKQLIIANEEIEEMNSKMEKELKKRESKMKSDLINTLQDRDRNVNEKLMKAKRREDQLKGELEGLKNQGPSSSEEVARMKVFFDKKIRNIKDSMSKESRRREREIAKKAIVAYNKKKEKIYNAAIKDALVMENRPEEVDEILAALRNTLALAEDVYGPENFFLCGGCGEAVHISQNICSNCNAKFDI
jgi:hypothetical protein